jgi:hypothetical protein
MVAYVIPKFTPKFIAIHMNICTANVGVKKASITVKYILKRGVETVRMRPPPSRGTSCPTPMVVHRSCKP